MKRMLAIIWALTMTLSSLNAAIAEEAAAVSQSSQQASTSQPGDNRPPEKPGETSGQPDGGNNQAELQANAQILEGSVLVGSNAFLTLTLANGSDFIGSISGVITNSRGETISTETGNVAVTMDAASQWSLTADSYMTSFFGNAGQVISNGYTLYVNGVALEGIK